MFQISGSMATWWRRTSMIRQYDVLRTSVVDPESTATPRMLPPPAARWAGEHCLWLVLGSPYINYDYFLRILQTI